MTSAKSAWAHCLHAASLLSTAGGKPGDLLPRHSVIYAMTTAWRQEGRDWRCYNAHWENKV